MPSVMDLALCANAVYDRNTIKIGPWMRTGEPYGDDSFGFYASAFLHENGRDLVVAYRGTNDLSDAVADVKIFLGKYPNQAIHAEKALKDILTKHRNIKSVHLTGHSLGGGLASLMGDAHNLPAVTFNAPGMARSSIPDWVPMGIKDVVAWGKAIFNSENDILHIRANYDLVSIGTGPRMGIVHNVSTMCKVNSDDVNGVTVTLPGYGAVKLLVTAGKFILCQHEMLSIINALKGDNLYYEFVNFSKF